jgi:MraZ protein
VETYFNGRYVHGLDDKRRLQFPAKWRSTNGGEEFALIVWPHGNLLEACVLGLTKAEWVSMVEKLKAMSFGDPQADTLRRVLGNNTEHVTVDKSGRISLPEWMTKAVGIGKQVTLAGMVHRFQLWEPERFKTANQLDAASVLEAMKMI